MFSNCRAFFSPVKQFVFSQSHRQDRRSQIDGKAFEDLDEGNAEEFAAEGQRTQNQAVEGVVGVMTPESFCLDIVQEAS